MASVQQADLPRTPHGRVPQRSRQGPCVAVAQPPPRRDQPGRLQHGVHGLSRLFQQIYPAFSWQPGRRRWRLRGAR